jgi:hypothetical protein
MTESGGGDFGAGVATLMALEPGQSWLLNAYARGSAGH